MSVMTMNRPSLTQACLNVLDTVWMTPSRVAHAHEMRQAAEQVFAMSDAELAAKGVTREQALYRIAQAV